MTPPRASDGMERAIERAIERGIERGIERAYYLLTLALAID